MTLSISSFPVSPLSEHAKIQAGFAFKSNQFTNNRNDVPLVKGENVQQGCIDWAASKYWPAVDVEAHHAYQLNIGDVVLAMDRPWVSAGLKWAYIKPTDPRSLLVQRVSRLRAKDGLDQTYLRCLISSNYFSAYIQPIVTGVNVPHISGRQIGGFRIPLPKLEVQRKIAAVISAYDDLIDNNRQRIAILNRIAEQLYREWFVRFRFPGFRHVEFAKGIPPRWRIAKLSELASINANSVKKGCEPESVCYLDISAVTTNVVEIPTPISYRDAPGRARRKVKHGDMIWSSVRPANRAYGLILDPPANLIASTGFAVLSHREGVPFSFIRFAVTTDNFVDQMTAVAKGSAYPATSFDDFENAKLLLPTPDLLAEFDRIVLPMLTMAHQLGRQNETLKAARDSLLPRLISGKLRVDELDIQFPPSMQDAAA